MSTPCTTSFVKALQAQPFSTSQTFQVNMLDLPLKSVISEDIQELAFALSVPDPLVGTAR